MYGGGDGGGDFMCKNSGGDAMVKAKKIRKTLPNTRNSWPSLSFLHR